MRPLGVVKLAPRLNDKFCFTARHEILPARAFILQLAIEASYKPVLPGGYVRIELRADGTTLLYAI